MSDTLLRLNLDDARAVLASCDGAPHASGAACQRERAALIEEVAQLRAALTVEKKINEYADHTSRCFGDQAQWWNTTSFEDIQRTPIPCSCGFKAACEARAALSPAPIAQQSPETKD